MLTRNIRIASVNLRKKVRKNTKETKHKLKIFGTNLIVKFVVEAFALKVFVPAPEKITLLKAEFPVKVPAIV